MTMAPWLVGASAAHDPRPAAGLKDMPSTVTATSVRDQAIRTIPSGAEVVFVPAAPAIRSALSLAGSAWKAADAHHPRPPTSNITTTQYNILDASLFMAGLLAVGEIML